MNPEQIMREAFASPNTSNACRSLGQLFAKNNTGYDFETLKNKIKFDEASIWFTLDRLINEVKVIETYPEFPEGVADSNEEVKIPYKFRIKEEYSQLLTQYVQVQIS